MAAKRGTRAATSKSKKKPIRVDSGGASLTAKKKKKA